MKYEFQKTTQENLQDVGGCVNFSGDIDDRVSLGTALPLLILWRNADGGSGQ